MWFKNKKTGEPEMRDSVEEEVYIIVADYKHMIQRIHYIEPTQAGDEYGYRTAYYTLDKDGRHENLDTTPNTSRRANTGNF